MKKWNWVKNIKIKVKINLSDWIRMKIIKINFVNKKKLIKIVVIKLIKSIEKIMLTTS